MLAAGALAVAAIPHSASAHAGGPIKVALIDVRPEMIDGDDRNVTMIDLTPEPPTGKMFAFAKAGGTNHGVIVATSFVREVRRIDRDVPIEIYTINPFVKTGTTGETVFSMSTFREGMRRLREHDVRVGIVTFAVSDAAAGARIAEEFKANDMIVLAAAPNEPNDPGIYPAATPGMIAIAEGKTNAAIHKDPSYRTFVNFVVDGYYVGRRATVTGSSFAAPKAAAYAAFMARDDPKCDVRKVTAEFDRMGRSYSTLPEGVKRIGTDDMIDDMRVRYASTPKEGDAAVALAAAYAARQGRSR